MAVQTKSGKAAARPAAPRQAEDAEQFDDVTEKIVDVRNKMAGIYADEDTLLMKLLKETENLTRSTLNIEFEIKRQRTLQADLSGNNRQLAKELEVLDNENAALVEDQKEIEKEYKKLKAKNESVKADIDHLSGEKKDLDREATKLQRDVSNLETKNAKMSDDVERLQALKEDYMKSIAKFKEMRDELIP
jgi:chromosome segregation ATPase